MGCRREVKNQLLELNKTLGDQELTRLPAEVQDALTMAALCLPWADANMRWPVRTEVYCADATPCSDAIVILL